MELQYPLSKINNITIRITNHLIFYFCSTIAPVKVVSYEKNYAVSSILSYTVICFGNAWNIYGTGTQSENRCS
jgi:hypothetical protein